MKALFSLTGAAVMLTLSGCNLFTNYKVLEANERLAIVTDATEQIGNGQSEDFSITCPEASPDALMMLAGSVSGESKAGVNLAAAFSENGANIGLRTHSIQLLRDQLFSICQGYANRGLSRFTYQTLLKKNQENTIALMAIEQLTGVLKAQQVTIKTDAKADASSLVKKTDDLAKARDKLKAIKDQESQEAKDLKTSIAALEKDLENSQKSTATASGTAVVAVPETRDSNLTAANVQTITAAVTTLALEVIRNNKADMMFTCSDVLQSRPYILKTELNAKKKPVNFTPLESACRDYVKAKLLAETSEANLQLIKTDNTGQTINPILFQKLKELRETEAAPYTTQ
ncbi:hypothetical protein [Pseudomonas sp. ML96]|uniref:hypothetical protein n=1 Tax=Pseudomonas sp. ML96 TaxID=1523503 RepID=UPI0005BAB912|nr:hypothetical protein [Pseudomonas sp. ML96]